MENEIELCLTKNNEEIAEDFFKPDYKGQSLNSNKKFCIWKNKMIKIYGSDAKLYRCKNDDIYFYAPKKIDNYFIYESKCTSCNRQICYFCSRSRGNRGNDGDCCVKGKICSMILDDGFKIISEEKEEENIGHIICFNYPYELITFFIPIYSLFILFGLVSKNLYHAQIKFKNNEFDGFYFKDNTLSWNIVVINGGIALMISIALVIHEIYLIAIITIISLFSKFYPIKFFMGLILDQFK